MPRQSKYNKEEKDNVKSYQYKAAIYIRLSVEDGDKEENRMPSGKRYVILGRKYVCRATERTGRRRRLFSSFAQRFMAVKKRCSVRGDRPEHRMKRKKAECYFSSLVGF